jgi:hypothetical protein
MILNTLSLLASLPVLAKSQRVESMIWIIILGMKPWYYGLQIIQANSKSYQLSYPIRHGQVENWDLMEKFHQACIFKYLRCEPEDHTFLLVSIGISDELDRTSFECT